MTQMQANWCETITFARACEAKTEAAAKMGRVDLVRKWMYEAIQAHLEAAEYKRVDESRHGPW